MQQQHDKAAGLRGAFTVPGEIPYTKYVGNVGERCAKALLSERFPSATIMDANEVRMNQSGHDFVVSDKGRALVSVKALAHVEGFGWLQGSSEKSLAFDIVLHINFGCMLTPKGRYARFGIPVRQGPEVYIVPRRTVAIWTRDAAYGMRKTRWIYCWNRRPGPKDDAAQRRELLEWKDRLDILADAVGREAAR